jgi:hypothetical protein
VLLILLMLMLMLLMLMLMLLLLPLVLLLPAAFCRVWWRMPTKIVDLAPAFVNICCPCCCCCLLLFAGCGGACQLKLLT